MIDARRLELVIPEEPIAKGRPRAAVIKGHAHVYTPAKTAKGEWLIKQWVTKAMKGRRPFTGPLEVYITAVLRMPTSTPKSKRFTAQPMKRPDIDNYLKAALDGLSPCWVDDAQVVKLGARKRYA